jgi:hypothetical protein
VPAMGQPPTPVPPAAQGAQQMAETARNAFWSWFTTPNQATSGCLLDDMVANVKALLWSQVKIITVEVV